MATLGQGEENSAAGFQLMAKRGWGVKPAPRISSREGKEDYLLHSGINPGTWNCTEVDGQRNPSAQAAGACRKPPWYFRVYKTGGGRKHRARRSRRRFYLTVPWIGQNPSNSGGNFWLQNHLHVTCRDTPAIPPSCSVALWNTCQNLTLFWSHLCLSKLLLVQFGFLKYLGI